MPKNRVNTPKRVKQIKIQQRMPLFLAILGGLLILGLAAFFALQKNPSQANSADLTGNASIQVDKQMVDLGDIKLGNMAQVSFQITNTGTQSLKITKAPYIDVKEGC